MLQDGLGKVLTGTTSFEEIYRIIDIDDDLEQIKEISIVQEDQTDNQEASQNVEKSKKEDALAPPQITIPSLDSFIVNNPYPGTVKTE